MSLSEKLYESLRVDEGEQKKFLLRAPERLLNGIKDLADDMNTSVNEVIVHLMRLAIHDAKGDPRIQELKKKKEK